MQILFILKVMKEITCFEPKFKTLAGYIRGNDSLTLKDILSEVSYKTGVSEELIKSRIKKRKVVEARMFYFVRAKEVLPQISKRAIGKSINRKHSTVIWGMKQVNDIIELRKRYKELFGI